MKHKQIAIQLIFIGMIFSLIFTISCTRGATTKSAEAVSRSEVMLGTVCRITIYDNPQDAAFVAAFKRIADIENKMSLKKEESEINKVNKEGSKDFVAVSEDTFKVVERALEVARLSNGAFDPTIGPLVATWDIGGDNPRLPNQKEISQLLPLINYNDVELDYQNQSIKLAKENMVLDLGGIAKGYAADEVAKVLKEYNVKKAIINLGGNILVMGNKIDNTPWRIGVQNPEAERGGHVVVLDLEDQSLVTSGPYERFFIQDDIIYHHILNPETGYPVSTDLTSVSIVTRESMYADGLSTAVYVLGLKEGLALVESLEDVEAIFIDEQHNLYLSSGIANKKFNYIVSNPEFKVSPIKNNP
jgi:thiamine biosynthesis lipoprotein